MSDLSNFQNTLTALRKAPYKRSEAFKKYGDTNCDIPKRSTFWETHIGYVAKFEYAKFREN